MNPKRVTLGILLLVLAGCLLYAYRAMPRLETAPPRAAGERPRATQAAAPAAPTEAARSRIDFGYLADEPLPFPGAKRDIFRYGGRLAVAKAAPVAAPVAATPPAAGTPQPVPVAPVPIEVVQRSLGQFTFLGFLDKTGEKTVFLSSGGKLFLAKRGDSFGADGEFLVESVEGNLLKVRHPGRPEPVEIQLIERQKLNAAVSAPVKLPPRAVEPAPAAAKPFMPQRRSLRPATPQGAAEEQPVQEATEETAPAEKQAAETPADGAAAEGDVNVKTQ